MRINRVKAALREGKAVSGPIVEEARTVGAVAMMARAGHDFLWFDTEHNMLDWETLLTLVQHSLALDIVPLIRVTDLQYALVARALDTGALGVIIPRVDTAAEVEQAVSYAKYPPLGRRGAGGLARLGYEPMADTEAIAYLNAETLVVAQVESPRAIDNLDEITAVPGLDIVCVGPRDLSINLGIPGQTDHPRFIEAIERIVDRCVPRGIAVGMVSRDAAAFRRWHGMGIRFLVCNSDGNYVARGAAEDVKALREITG